MVILKRLLVLLTLVTFLFTSVLSFPVMAITPASSASAPTSAKSPFRDVKPNAWYYDHVRWAFDSGIVDGKGNGLFDPSGVCTRAEFITMLCRLDLGKDANLNRYIKRKPTFSDVKKGAWYEKYVEWAYANKYVSGTGEKTFSPERKITRQEMVVMIYNYFRAKGEVVDFSDVDLNKVFRDGKQIADWARDAVAFAYKVQIVQGIQDKTGVRFAPKADNTRAQAATVFHNTADFRSVMASMDTDQDELRDIDEPKYKTDPKNPDTDGDGAKDGVEVLYGTDPLRPDRSFHQTLSSGSVSEEMPVAASVEMELKGEQVGTLDITPVGVEDNILLSSNIPGYLGTAYDFEVNGEFDEATISFAYDASLGQIGPNFQPRIYYFDEETGILEELPNQQIKNGLVTAKVKHFSKYILLNGVEFDLAWATDIRKPQGKTGGDKVDVVFVVDESGSMETNDPSRVRVRAVQRFIDQMNAEDRAAIVGFSSGARNLVGLTDDKELAYSKSNLILENNGGTEIYKGIEKGIEEMKYRGRRDADRILVVLTDGQDSGIPPASAYEDAVKAAIKHDIIIYTVGLGQSVEKVLLTYIAESTGGRYFHATQADDLYAGYRKIQEDAIDYRADTNKDGITDYYAKLIWNGQLRLQNGSLEMFPLGQDISCPADIDGDGLLNGEEVVVVEMGDRVMLRFLSDPFMVDSDGDGYDDKADPHPLKKDYFTKNSQELYTLVDNSKFKYFKEAENHINSFWAQAGTAAVALLTFTDLQKEYTMEMVNFFKNNANEEYINYLQIAEMDTLVAVENDANISYHIKQIAKASDGSKKIVQFVTSAESIAAAAANIVQAKVQLSDARKLVKSTRSIAAYKGWVTRRQNEALKGLFKGGVSFQNPIIKMMTRGMQPNQTRRILQAAKKAGKTIDGTLKVFQYGTKVVSVLDLMNSGYELWDAYAGISSHNGNISAFRVNTDLLEYLSKNSRNDFARGAANFVLDTMAGQFYTAYHQMAVHFALGAASVIEVLSWATPLWYLRVAKGVFEVCNGIFGWSEDAKSMAKVICLYEMSAATTKFVNHYYLADSATENTSAVFGRHLENLVNMRITGEARYMQLQGKNGDAGAQENITKIKILAERIGLFAK